MASRGGKMVDGTDGMDFNHRERVASQYGVSASYKSKLKILSVIHFLLGVVHNIRLLPFLLKMAGLSFPSIPIIQELPQPSELEYGWLVSLPFVFMALSASKRSKSGPLQVFQLVILLCCISTSFITVFLLSPMTLEFLLQGTFKGQPTLFGQPFAVIWTAFLLFGCLIHILEIQVSRKLVAAWAPRHGGKKLRWICSKLLNLSGILLNTQQNHLYVYFKICHKIAGSDSDKCWFNKSYKKILNLVSSNLEAQNEYDAFDLTILQSKVNCKIL